MGVGAAMNGGNGDTVPLGYYPTPREATVALLRAEPFIISGGVRVWEPCGRGGAIAREIIAAGGSCIASDLVEDPDNEVQRLDVLSCSSALGRMVVTNPDFAIAEEIIRHLLGELKVGYMALLLKSSFWHAASRVPLWEQFRPARKYELTWRLDFLGLGKPAMECAWFVWDKRCARHCTVEVLNRPGSEKGQLKLFEGGF